MAHVAAHDQCDQLITWAVGFVACLTVNLAVNLNTKHTTHNLCGSMLSCKQRLAAGNSVYHSKAVEVTVTKVWQAGRKPGIQEGPLLVIDASEMGEFTVIVVATPIR